MQCSPSAPDSMCLGWPVASCVKCGASSAGFRLACGRYHTDSQSFSSSIPLNTLSFQLPSSGNGPSRAARLESQRDRVRSRGGSESFRGSLSKRLQNHRLLSKCMRRPSGGRVLKKYFSAKVYGYQLARDKAVAARLHMEEDARLWNSLSPGSRSPCRPVADTGSSTRVTTRSNSTVIAGCRTDSTSPSVSPSEQRDIRGADYGSRRDVEGSSGAGTSSWQDTAQSDWNLAVGEALASTSSAPCSGGTLPSVPGVPISPQTPQQQNRTSQQFPHTASQPETSGPVLAPLGVLMAPLPVVGGGLHTRVAGTPFPWPSSMAPETTATSAESEETSDQVSLNPVPAGRAQEDANAAERPHSGLVSEVSVVDRAELGTAWRTAAPPQPDEKTQAVADVGSKARPRLTQPQQSTPSPPAGLTCEGRDCGVADRDRASAMPTCLGKSDHGKENMCSANSPPFPQGTGSNTPPPEETKPTPPTPRFPPSWPWETRGSQVHAPAVGCLGESGRTEAVPTVGGGCMASSAPLVAPPVPTIVPFLCLPGTASAVPMGGIPGVFFPATAQPAFAPLCFVPSPYLPVSWRGGSSTVADGLFGFSDTFSSGTAGLGADLPAPTTAGLLSRDAGGGVQSDRTQAGADQLDTGKQPDGRVASRPDSPAKETNPAAPKMLESGADCKHAQSEISAECSSTACPSPENDKRVLQGDMAFPSATRFRGFPTASSVANALPGLASTTPERSASGLFYPYPTQSPVWPCAPFGAFPPFVYLANAPLPLPCVMPQTLPLSWAQTPPPLPDFLSSPEMWTGSTALASTVLNTKPSTGGAIGVCGARQPRGAPVNLAGCE